MLLNLLVLLVLIRIPTTMPVEIILRMFVSIARERDTGPLIVLKKMLMEQLKIQLLLILLLRRLPKEKWLPLLLPTDLNLLDLMFMHGILI